MSALPAGYSYEDDPARWDRDSMHSFLSQTYWTPGLQRAQMERALDHSFGVAVFQGSEQVGFARVVTDYARFAYLCDVYVEKPHRGRGVAYAMVEWLHHHPRLASVTRWLLITRDAGPVYEPLGYGPPNDMELFMQRRASLRS